MDWYSNYKILRGHWNVSKIKEVFPELDNLSYGEISDRLEDNDVYLIGPVYKKTPAWTRATVIPTIILYIILFLFRPLTYILTGKWGYSSIKLFNWFRMHGL